MSHFYLSHVRTVDEEWVASFFHDLCRVVAERTGRSPEVVGVRGKPHSPDVSVDLLGRSTVLVVLHSPRYFSQSYCRAELSYFQRRLNMQRSRTGHSADAVVPVMWEPDPAHALDTVVPYPPLGARSEAYRRDGLLHLVRLKARYRSAYEEVLRATADRIVVAAERLPEVHGFDAAGSHSPLGAPAPAGAQTVSFVVAATARENLPEQRQSSQDYGKTALDRSPWAPGEHEALLSLMKDAATALDFTATVLLVEWVAMRREKHRLLAAVDERNPETTTAPEPRSRDDSESAEHSITLDELLGHTLPLMHGQHSEYDRWGLSDAESPTSSLRKVLIRLQNEALKSMDVVRSPATPTEGLHTFPLLGRYSS